MTYINFKPAQFFLNYQADFHSLKNERTVGNHPISEKSDEQMFWFLFTRIAARFRHHFIIKVKSIYTNVIGFLF